MADTNAMADIRGIDIDKLAKGFADEDNVFKRFVTNSKTSAREIRWYQKTSGFLDTSTTDDTAGSLMTNVSSKARPFVTEQSWTRQTSYVKKYFIESPMFSIEDLKDNDIDILATNVRDLVRGVGRKVDLRIFSVLNEATAAAPTVPVPTTVNTAAATNDGWNVPATADPIYDILNAKQAIRSYGYNPEGMIISMNSIEHKYLLSYLINTKGSSIPNFSSEKVKSGVVMELLGCNIVVTENQTTDWVTMWVSNRAATWKQFMPITSVVMDEPGIGKKIRVWEEGECLLTDPRAVFVLSDVMN